MQSAIGLINPKGYKVHKLIPDPRDSDEDQKTEWFRHIKLYDTLPTTQHHFQDFDVAYIIDLPHTNPPSWAVEWFFVDFPDYQVNP
jgi:hypothetical protein